MTLIAHQIGQSFVGLRALDHVDLELEPGTIEGLIGPNGSGKTTLLNVISGVLAPTDGRVILDNVEIGGWPAHRIVSLGIARTFQNIRLFSRMTVLENVEVGAAVHRGEQLLRAQARDILNELGLAAHVNRVAGTLAYGDQRRLEIARALATRPRYLLLDEPAAGMNESESDRLLETISVLRRERGLGVLVVDHDLRLIMRLCDRITVLNEGRLISSGTPAHVRADQHVIEAYLGRRAAEDGVTEVPSLTQTGDVPVFDDLDWSPRRPSGRV